MDIDVGVDGGHVEVDKEAPMSGDDGSEESLLRRIKIHESSGRRSRFARSKSEY